MDIFRHDVKAGLFIMGSGALFLFALFRVGGLMDHWQDALEVTLVFGDAQQTERGAEIFYKGLKVGRVTDIGMGPEGGKVHMEARLQADILLHEGTTARVVDKSVLGGKVIELLAPDPAQGTWLADGAKIEGLPPGGLTAMMDTVTGLMEEYRGKLDGMLTKFESLLDNLNEAALKTSSGIDGFAGTSGKLQDTLDAYKKLAEDVDTEVIGLAHKMNGMLDTAEGKIDQVGGDVSAMTQSMQTELKQISAKLEKVLESSDTLLVNSNQMVEENRVALAETLKTLERTMANLEVFSAQIAERPSSLVWKGRKRKKRD